MQRGEIDLVIVGSDRTLGRTGEVANKIGTYTKAVLAARHGIPFYVAIPLSTIDWNLRAAWTFRLKNAARTKSWARGASAANAKANRRASTCAWPIPTSGARNPGFDVTPAGIDHRHHHARRNISSRDQLWKNRDANWDLPVKGIVAKTELASGERN